jgi:hypothetical protein
MPQQNSEIFDELRRRSKDAGAEWRAEELPWRPSFLPLLVERAQRRRYKSGPDVLLEDAKELRESKAISRYRKAQAELEHERESEDERVSALQARKELEAAAEKVAKSLDMSREQLRTFRHLSVDMLRPREARPPAASRVASSAGRPEQP